MFRPYWVFSAIHERERKREEEGRRARTDIQYEYSYFNADSLLFGVTTFSVMFGQSDVSLSTRFAHVTLLQSELAIRRHINVRKNKKIKLLSGAL